MKKKKRLNEKQAIQSTSFPFSFEIRLKKRLATPGTKITDDIQEILSDPDIDVVFEAIVGEEPAYTYLSEAIEKGCHVITANKTMFAKHGPALLKHAEFRDVQVRL